MMIRTVQLLFVFIILFIGNRTQQVNTSCGSASKLYQIVPVDDNDTISRYNFNENELVEECHLSFVEKVLEKNCSNSSSSPTSKHPTFLQKYGYGFIVVFIICVLSLAGFLAFPLMQKPYYKYLNAFFTAVAVGTLIADTVYELIPVIIKSDTSSSHNHEHGEFISNKPVDHGIHVPLYIWQMTVLIITAYVFYVVELMIHAFIHHREYLGKKNSYDLNHNGLPLSEMSVLPVPTITKTSRSPSLIATNTIPNLTVTAEEHYKKSTGWMIIIGDGIHNVADGLAIGAAFAENTIFGVTTAVAIGCHELPTELGEYMVLIESGFTWKRALLFNFISACTAIIGFFIGASIAQEESTRTWIFAVTAGTFMYIALVDLWPSLMPETDKFDWIRFICVCFGYLSGVAIMLILTIFDEKIVQLG